MGLQRAGFHLFFHQQKPADQLTAGRVAAQHLLIILCIIQRHAHQNMTPGIIQPAPVF